MLFFFRLIFDFRFDLTSDFFMFIYTQKRATRDFGPQSGVGIFREEKLLPFRLTLVGSFGFCRLLGQLARPEHVRTAGTAHPN